MLRCCRHMMLMILYKLDTQTDASFSRDESDTRLHGNSCLEHRTCKVSYAACFAMHRRRRRLHHRRGSTDCSIHHIHHTEMRNRRTEKIVDAGSYRRRHHRECNPADIRRGSFPPSCLFRRCSRGRNAAKNFPCLPRCPVHRVAEEIESKKTNSKAARKRPPEDATAALTASVPALLPLVLSRRDLRLLASKLGRGDAEEEAAAAGTAPPFKPARGP